VALGAPIITTLTANLLSNLPLIRLPPGRKLIELRPMSSPTARGLQFDTVQ